MKYIGNILYKQVQIAFDAISKGEQEIIRMKQFGVGHLRIGVSTTLCKYLLLSYLKGFVGQYPHIKVTILCQSTLETVKLLEEDKIDIGLIGKPEHLKNLTFYPVKTIQDTFVTTTAYYENLKLRNNEEKPDILKDGNIMLLNKDNITRRYIEQYFENQAISINQVLEVSNMDLLIEFAKTGIGIACVIREFVLDDLKEGNLIELPILKKIPTRQVGFAYDANCVQNKAILQFISYSMKELF